MVDGHQFCGFASAQIHKSYKHLCLHVLSDFLDEEWKCGQGRMMMKFKLRFNSWFWHQSLCKFSQIVRLAPLDVSSWLAIFNTLWKR